MNHYSLVVYVELFLPLKETMSIYFENHWKIHRMTLPQIFDGLLEALAWEYQNVRLCRLLSSLRPTQRLAQYPCSRLLLGSPARSDTISICVRRTSDATKRAMSRWCEKRTWTHLNAQKGKPNVGLTPLRAGRTHIRANVHETIFDNASVDRKDKFIMMYWADIKSHTYYQKTSTNPKDRRPLMLHHEMKLTRNQLWKSWAEK